MPVRINSSWRLATLPTSSVIRSRSRVTICEALATESLDKPVALAGRSTLPGASAQTRLLVNGTQTTVRIRLRFSASPCATITGLGNTGLEPVGSGKSAQYTCPWEITIRPLRGYVGRQLPMLDQVSYQPSRNAVHCFGHGLRIVPRDIFGYRLGVDLAARFFQSPEQPFDLREYLIGNGNRRFHTRNMTGSLAARK